MLFAMKVIDIHTHWGTAAEIEQRRPLWDSLGCRHICVSGNLQATAEMISQCGDYVVGLAYLKMDSGADELWNPELPVSAVGVDEIDRYREQGFRGLKIICTAKPYSHEDYYPYYERAEKLGMPILFHTGWAIVPNQRQENFRPVYLQSIASTFRELKIIGGHLGGWQFSAEAVAAMWKHPNVYFDLSGGTMVRQGLGFYRDLFSLVPPGEIGAEPQLDMDIFSKLMFGSDGMLGFDVLEEMIRFYEYLMRELEIPETVQRKIYYENAAKLLGFDS